MAEYKFSRKEDRTFRKEEEPEKISLLSLTHDELRKKYNKGSLEEQIREHKETFKSMEKHIKMKYPDYKSTYKESDFEVSDEYK